MERPAEYIGKNMSDFSRDELMDIKKKRHDAHDDRDERAIRADPRWTRPLHSMRLGLAARMSLSEAGRGAC
jgi:hypothetical protein